MKPWLGFKPSNDKQMGPQNGKEKAPWLGLAFNRDETQHFLRINHFFFTLQIAISFQRSYLEKNLEKRHLDVLQKSHQFRTQILISIIWALEWLLKHHCCVCSRGFRAISHRRHGSPMWFAVPPASSFQLIRDGFDPRKTSFSVYLTTGPITF